ncbi:hypothetical protein QVD99_002099 [Batrachochytrium dendrobatidis]|nr:hypothetical protein O5D80_005842 [Batrachochytrium dendrobatidis]KAK5671383.1 hypothetical protein QVD99_002099 [Batrachochytrium dendrobatidis]
MGLASKHHSGPRPDPHPEIPAAGSVIHVDHSNSSKLCLDWGNHTTYTKRSLLDPMQHIPGQVSPNVSAVSEKARSLTHGVICDRTHNAGEVLFPPCQHPLIAEQDALMEANYHRKEHQTLGKSAPLITPLPDFTNDASFKFGKVSKKEVTVAEIMYPPPLDSDLDDSLEAQEKRRNHHRQYLISHGSYAPGERRMHYGLEWTTPNHDIKGAKQRFDNDGSRVQDAMYWEDVRLQEIKSKLVSSRLAEFRERHQPQIGCVHDPIKSTMEHLPKDYTFGITFPVDEFSVRELLGNSEHTVESAGMKNKTRLPPAGLPTNRHDNLAQPRHIIPKIMPNEDQSIVLKITEDVPGGRKLENSGKQQFDVCHTFGIPTVRDPCGHVRTSKLADSINYGDELGAKGLMYPTPRNVYGIDQLREFEQYISQLRSQSNATAS